VVYIRTIVGAKAYSDVSLPTIRRAFPLPIYSTCRPALTDQPRPFEPGPPSLSRHESLRPKISFISPQLSEGARRFRM
jgi:hypothetical protein